jgi:hypothetical protein
VLAGLGLWLAGLRGLAVGFSVTTLIMAVVLLREVRPVAEVRFREAVSTPALATAGATLAALLALAVHLPWFVALMAGGCVYAICIYALASARIHALLGLGLAKA